VPSLELVSARGESEVTAAAAAQVEEVLQPQPEAITMVPEVDAEPAGSAAVTTTAGSAEAGEATSEQASAEPSLIEVWRPGRAEGRHREPGPRRGAAKQGRRHSDRRPAEHAAEAPPAPAGDAVAAAPGTETGTRDAHTRPQRPPRHHFGEQRPDRPQRDRERPPVKRFERREKAPDPNSPFAKLAALKAQLEADAKERR
jgi:ATP-dependent RNA helicase SUPV3L1/SUV3